MTTRDPHSPERSQTLDRSTAGLFLGIDIGGTKVKFAWFDTSNEAVRGKLEFATDDRADDLTIPGFARDIARKVRELEDAHGQRFRSIGLAAPGIAANDERSIAHMIGRLTRLQGLDWSELLGRSRPIAVSNDGHAALVGECWRGAAKGRRHVVMLTLGTGVGGAVAVDGRILRGRLGRAGHLGHVTVDHRGFPDIVGTPGSLEDAIGEASLIARSSGAYRETAALVRDVEAGDANASRIWALSLDCLAAAVVSFINAFDPEAVVIGGGIANADDCLFPQLSARLARLEWRPHGSTVDVLPGTLRGWAGAYGAAFIGRRGGLSTLTL